MMGNVGERVVKMFRMLVWLVICLIVAGAIAFGLRSMLGCTVLHVSYDKHYVGEPPKEERAADLIERIFDGEVSEKAGSN